MAIQIPHNFEPRKYQLPLLKALDSGTKRAFCLWHRRAGKDKVLINLIAKKAFEKVGIYFYLFPTFTQAKKVIWDGIDNDGFGFMDHFPKEVVKAKNGTELKIELINGSIIQLIGTDNYDAVRGTNPVGCVFSEYAFHNPLAWEIIRPILAVNGGWAVFNTTPNGKNHAFDLWNQAEQSDNWFTQKLTVEDTKVVSQETLDEERLQMTREFYFQEYFCSFDVGAMGAVYGEQMERVREENRITSLQFYPDRAIDIALDLGSRDATAIWFSQRGEGEFQHLIKYYENRGKSLDHYFTYINEFLDEKRATLRKIILPHDSRQNRLGMDKTVFGQFVEEYGGHKVECLGKIGIDMGIEKTRQLFPKLKFDFEACETGIRCIENYKYKYDEKKKIFSREPEHDWASHGADALRYLALTSEVKQAYVSNVSDFFG
jgi:phage terminase large subunit